MDCSLWGSSIHRILQARVLELAAISFFRESSPPRYWTRVSSIASRWLYYLSHQGSSPFGAVPSGNLPGALPSGDSPVGNFQLRTGRQRQAATPLGRQNVKRFHRSALHFLFPKAEQWYLSSACPLVYSGKMRFVLPAGDPRAWISYFLRSALGIMMCNPHNKDILPWLEWKPRVSSLTQEGWSGSLVCSLWIALALTFCWESAGSFARNRGPDYPFLNIPSSPFTHSCWKMLIQINFNL